MVGFDREKARGDKTDGCRAFPMELKLMAYLNDERGRLPATIAATVAVLSVLAVAQLVLSVPASAHARGYHHHYLARREAAPTVARNFAPTPYQDSSSPIDSMAASAASAAGIPASLVERVIKRESGGNPRAVSQGNYGLMQIRLGTARAMGYAGSAEGLLDAQTNMTYAVKYLAGAYRAAGGNENRAVALYASGYYAQAKMQDRFDQAQYDHPQYQQVRYAQVRNPHSSRSRYVEANYGDGYVAAARPQFTATPGESGWQPGLYAYAPYPLHYRVRHYRHHAV
jgi:soluble lytic murein transglycosylase-like protein